MKKVSISNYNSELRLIYQIRSLIEHKYKDLFYAVIIHGSIATNEIIKYSDFDGLLIIEDKFEHSNLLEAFKRDSLKKILDFDPLQHHGWFQIKKSEMMNYPENYLPISSLSQSKLIYPNAESFQLEIKVNKNVDFQTDLKNMLYQFERRDSNRWRPKNIYQLKSILSQVMLIPSMYFTAINKRGIFKRESFKQVRDNFSKDEWMPIEKASNIRQNWTYKLNVAQRILLKNPNKLVRKIATNYFAPKIPLKIQKELDDNFYNNLVILVRKIQKDIE